MSVDARAVIRVNGKQIGTVTSMRVTFAEDPPCLTHAFKASEFPSTYRATIVGEAIKVEQVTGPATIDLAPDLPIWAHNNEREQA